jgi:hypothetical protein
MPKKHPYTCPRCEYFTSKKTDMYKHLYNNQKPCPGIVEYLELTDTIKQLILDNRVYHPPKQPTQQLINNNNYHIIVNYINKKDFQEKLSQYLEYTNNGLINSSDIHESILQKRKANLKKEKFCKERAHNIDSVIKVLQECTSSNHINQMNIAYDKVMKTLHIYDVDEWNGHNFETGVKEIIRTIQDAYLDTYEEYLLEQYVSSSMYLKQCIKEALVEYYEFLQCFGSTAVLLGTDDLAIDSREGDIGKLYKSVNVSASKRNEIKKLVYNVIKTNCNANVIELNKQMMELIKMDEDFKNKILGELTLNAI